MARNGDVAALCAALEALAPARLAAEWDNVGLLVGAGEWPCRRVLVSGDLTAAVLDEAVQTRCEAIVSYHPPIFRPVKRFVCTRGSAEGLAAEALSRRIAVFSPHTAWDAAPGGTNDAVVALLGLDAVRPLTPAARTRGRCKLVVFVPAAQLEQVAEALFAAGAGVIGDYAKCSYRLSGEGTFFGQEGTSPAVGQKGRLERVEEVRLEVIVPRDRLGDVVVALRKAHPYEEPAFDCYPLIDEPGGSAGQGRVGRFRKATTLAALAASLKRRIGAAGTQIVGAGRTRLSEAIVCVGSAGSLPFEAVGTACGPGVVVVTGEVRHHDALRYQRCGASVVALGHWASERPGVAALARRLAEHESWLEVRLSRADDDPFTAVR